MQDITVNSYIVVLAIIGLVGLLMSWLPSLAKKINLSYSIIFLAIGLFIYAGNDTLVRPNHYLNHDYTLRLTELIVIIALMSTGLRIDHPFSFSTWRIPFRLVTITMLVSIAVMTYLGHALLGLGLSSALLLGAVLAPTDPVLAADVQVGPPNKGKNDLVRFSLTAEAGLNDGAAFPFVWLAILLATMQGGQTWFAEWFLKDIAYRLTCGVIIGFLMGRFVTYLFFHLPERLRMLLVRDGLVAISSTLLVYGLTELVHGYGFVAVFVTALTIRNYEMGHEYHTRLYIFTDQIERILLAVFLILLGGSIIGGILKPLTLEMALVGLAFVLVIRPLAALIGMAGIQVNIQEKLAIGFFGIKGVGSIYYLSFAMLMFNFPDAEKLWAMTAFVVLVSILLHGLTAASVLKKIRAVSTL